MDCSKGKFAEEEEPAAAACVRRTQRQAGSQGEEPPEG